MRKGGHQFSKLRPVGGRAGDFLPEHLFAPGSPQLGKLAGEVLRLGRDAGVAVNHAPKSGTELWNRKAKFFQRLGFVPNILSFARIVFGQVRFVICGEAYVRSHILARAGHGSSR
jgi:hypothetical protein